LLLERSDGPRLSELEAAGSVVIGPEGGFTPDEVAAAGRAGLALAGLGPRILRSETVAVAAAAVILSRTGDFA
jgi:16S rRNA (uracil1498-N3)-methyltransferase